MERSRLEKDMIAQPELWRMMLIVSPCRLDVALYPPVSREELIWRSYDLDPVAGTALKALEDVIYDNPLLLSDFKSVGCVVDYGSWLVAPSEASEADCRELLAHIYSDDIMEDGDIEIYETGASNARIALVQDPKIKAFLSRTFYNIKFVERKAALCRYFVAYPEGLATTRVCVTFRSDTLTLIALDGDRLLLANDFHYNTASDAAYYILACVQTLGLDPDVTDVAVSGDLPLDERVEPILRKFIPGVKPVPFPMLRYRVSKNTLHAPLDLLISQQCE